jgi:hypothetical protein
VEADTAYGFRKGGCGGSRVHYEVSYYTIRYFHIIPTTSFCQLMVRRRK